MSKHHFNCIDSASVGESHYNTHDEQYDSSEIQYNNSEVQSDRDTTSNNNDSKINNTQQPLRDINYESSFSRQRTSDLNNQPEIDLLFSEKELKENLTIESLNKTSLPSEEEPQQSEQNTQHSDYTQMHCYEYVNMIIVKALIVNALNEPITYNDTVTCREAQK